LLTWSPGASWPIRAELVVVHVELDEANPGVELAPKWTEVPGRDAGVRVVGRRQHDLVVAADVAGHALPS
jgi:hypothetical protein